MRDRQHSERGFAPPNSPQFNGCAGRGFAILEAISRAARLRDKAIIHGLGCPKYIDRLWSEAINLIRASLSLKATAVNSPLMSLRDVARSIPEHPTQAVFVTREKEHEDVE